MSCLRLPYLVAPAVAPVGVYATQQPHAAAVADVDVVLARAADAAEQGSGLPLAVHAL